MARPQQRSANKNSQQVQIFLNRQVKEMQPGVQKTAVIAAAGPSMPRITIDVEVDPGFMVKAIHYDVNLTYAIPGHHYIYGPYTGQGANNIQINFGKRVYGGKLAGRVNLEIRRPNGSTYWTGWMVLPANLSIVGENPGKELILKQCNSIPSAVIASKMSNLQMFNAQGMPTFNNGFGLFALKQPDPQAVWHWRLNVKFGVRDFVEHESEVSRLPKLLRNSNPAKYKGLPDFDPHQLKLETYQSYSKGHYWVPKRSGLIFKKWSWTKSSQVNHFAEECFILENELSK